MTSFCRVDLATLHAALDELKRRNVGRRVVTNYFLQPLEGLSNLRMMESESTLCFMHDEWDFARLYFSTYDILNFEKDFLSANWPPIVVVDWIAKGDSSTVDLSLSKLGFHLHATYDRILCKSIRKERTNTSMCLAENSDCETIHALLFRVFDKYSDHIMSPSELKALCEQGQVLVSRDMQGMIDGLVVFPVHGKTCNFNFLYNSGGLSRLPQILGSFYGALTERGVESGFSWVRRTRPLVLKLHESFGWKKDGLVDYIYMR